MSRSIHFPKCVEIKRLEPHRVRVLIRTVGVTELTRGVRVPYLFGRFSQFLADFICLRPCIRRQSSTDVSTYCAIGSRRHELNGSAILYVAASITQARGRL
eukprot:scaffold316405_cov43-Prasinocladus_malaysianus.AAC.1